MDFGNRMFFQANAKAGSTPPKPIKIPRPGSVSAEAQERAQRKQSSVDEIKRFMGNKLRVKKKDEHARN